MHFVKLDWAVDLFARFDIQNWILICNIRESDSVAPIEFVLLAFFKDELPNCFLHLDQIIYFYEILIAVQERLKNC